MSGFKTLWSAANRPRSAVSLAAVALALLLVVFLWPPRVRAQDGKICKLLAPTFEVIGSGAGALELAQGATDTCMVQYNGPTHWVLVAKLQNADVAHQAYIGHKGSLVSNAYFGEIGDESFIFTMEDSSLDRRKRFHLVFRRDCYIYSADAGRPEDGAFQSGVGPVNLQDMLKKARATDVNLKAQGACTQSSPGPVQAGLGVRLSCQYNFADEGRVECAAQPVGARADADLSYVWQIDGKLAQSATSARLSITDIPPGPHSVSVVANDGRNNLASPPDRTDAMVIPPPQPPPERQEGRRLWLEAAPVGRSLRGDGKDALPLEVRAWTDTPSGPQQCSHLVNIVGAPAHNNVIWRRHTSIISSLQATAWMTRPVFVKVLFTGRHDDGRVATCTIEVEVQPILEIVVTVEKAGFQRQTIAESVQSECASCLKRAAPPDGGA